MYFVIWLIITGLPLLTQLSAGYSNVTSALPPPVDAQIWGPCKPRVQYVDAAQGVWSLDGVLQGWVVVQAQSLPEPVDGVDNHAACFLYAAVQSLKKK